MPLPRWLARVNRRVFNPREIRRGVRPVLTHTGRVSGTTYRTPLDAHPVEGGFVFFVMYGATRCDWVRNVLAAGSATLTVRGEEIPLVAPRLLTRDQAVAILPPGARMPAAVLRVNEYLRMDRR